MKLRLLLCIFLSATGISALAQNNLYEIDDECYVWFQKAENLAGKEGFEESNSMLLKTARAKGDTKAETLYYIENLKHYSKMESSKENDARLDEAMIKARDAASASGYKQYFYYAYQVCMTYYFNNGQVYKSITLAQEMQQTAFERHDEYGIWTSNKFLASLFIEQNDYVSAKKYILTALRIFDTTSDKAIRRQSPTRLYCDLSDTYPIGGDSVKINITKAIMWSKQHMDSLRCHYYQARRAFVEGNKRLYSRYRDVCLADSSLSSISPSAHEFFRLADAVNDGRLEGLQDDILKLKNIREIKVLANACEVNGYTSLAFDLEKKLVANLEERISYDNRSKFSELEVLLGKAELSAELAGQEKKLSRVSHVTAILLALLLAATAIFSFIYIRILRRSKKRDMLRINELRDANEKVRMANAAKTRFVQNMSHEVRTPLNAIVGFSQLLSLPDGMLSSEEKEEYSRIIVNNSDMLTMLLDDILNASAMDNGSYRVEYSTAECCRMCRAALDSVEHRVQPGVSLSMETGFEGTHEVYTDPRRVQQILINFLTNACKHTMEGSIVLRCSLTENPGMVTFSVTDTGPGVPPGQEETIFDRFTKLNEFVQGTGLGLSICREIAGKMGGRVFLDTDYTKGGARFVFCIPDNQGT